MKIKTLFNSTSLATMLLAVCCYSNIKADDSLISIDKVTAAIHQAETARQQAASVGGEWRDTEKMINSAQDALKQGDLTAALELATEAQYQGQLGYKQAVGQKNLDFPAYFR